MGESRWERTVVKGGDRRGKGRNDYGGEKETEPGWGGSEK